MPEQIVYGCRGLGTYTAVDNAGTIEYTDTPLGKVKKDGVEVTGDGQIIKVESADSPTVLKAIRSALDVMIKGSFISASLELMKTVLGLPNSALTTVGGVSTLTLKSTDIGGNALEFPLYLRALCDDGLVRTYRFPRVASVGNLSLKHGRDEAAELPFEFQAMADDSDIICLITEEA